MPKISISTYIPADPEQVFGQVTAFPTRGAPNSRLLEDKYGHLEEQDGRTYKFRERTEAGVLWQYTFDPPRRRSMESLNSNWSDRIDTFEPLGDGTNWTITWRPKPGGAPVLLRWLLFRLKDRKMLYAQLMQPVVDHFQKREFY